jgi:hypothetical protein
LFIYVYIIYKSPTGGKQLSHTSGGSSDWSGARGRKAIIFLRTARTESSCT